MYVSRVFQYLPVFASKTKVKKISKHIPGNVTTKHRRPRNAPLRNSHRSLTATCDQEQGGQSRGQHDWVHEFPEPVKSFIAFVTLSQISCD